MRFRPDKPKSCRECGRWSDDASNPWRRDTDCNPECWLSSFGEHAHRMLALWALCGVDHGEIDGKHAYSVDIERLDFLVRHGHPATGDDDAHEILEALSLVARELGDPGAYERGLGDGE